MQKVEKSSPDLEFPSVSFYLARYNASRKKRVGSVVRRSRVWVEVEPLTDSLLRV